MTSQAVEETWICMGSNRQFWVKGKFWNQNLLNVSTFPSSQTSQFCFVDFYHFQNNWNFHLECKPNKHKTAFHDSFSCLKSYRDFYRETRPWSCMIPKRRELRKKLSKKGINLNWKLTQAVQKTMALGSPVGPILRLFNHSGTDTIQ